jgi:hypothetical protein
VWGGDQLSRGRRPESGCELALLDPQVACEFGNVAAQMSDMGLDIRFAPRRAAHDAATARRCVNRVKAMATDTSMMDLGGTNLWLNLSSSLHHHPANASQATAGRNHQYHR